MRSKPRFRLVPRHLAVSAVVGLTPVWALPLTTLSCVPGFACDPTPGVPPDPGCGGSDGGATDGDATSTNPDGGGGG